MRTADRPASMERGQLRIMDAIGPTRLLLLKLLTNHSVINLSLSLLLPPHLSRTATPTSR